MLCMSKENAMKKPPTHIHRGWPLWDETAGQLFGVFGLLLLGSTNINHLLGSYVLLFLLAGALFYGTAIG